MSLDATAREANFIDSLKKFCVDNLYTTAGIEITFDTTLTIPKVAGSKNVVKWIAIGIGPILTGTICECLVRFYCCSKNDKEGFVLAQLRDNLMTYLTDSTANDGTRRIPLYQSQNWTQVGSIIIYPGNESERFTLEDLTKVKIVEATLKWGAKL